MFWKVIPKVWASNLSSHLRDVKTFHISDVGIVPCFAASPKPVPFLAISLFVGILEKLKAVGNPLSLQQKVAFSV